MRAVILVSTFALGAAGCTAGSSTPAIDTKAEEQAIRRLDDQWLAAMQKKDLDAVVAFYTPDAWAMWPDAPTAKGTTAIRAAWTEMFKAPNLSLSSAPEKIEVAQSGDVATDVGTGHLEMDTPQGHVKEDAKYLVVWKKVNGVWKAQYDTFNSNAPATPPSTATDKK